MNAREREEAVAKEDQIRTHAQLIYDQATAGLILRREAKPDVFLYALDGAFLAAETFAARQRARLEAIR